MMATRRSSSDRMSMTPDKENRDTGSSAANSRVSRRRSVLKVLQTTESELPASPSEDRKRTPKDKRRRKSVSFGGIHTAVFEKSPNVSFESRGRDSVPSPAWPSEAAEMLPELTAINGESSLVLDMDEEVELPGGTTHITIGENTAIAGVLAGVEEQQQESSKLEDEEAAAMVFWTNQPTPSTSNNNKIVEPEQEQQQTSDDFSISMELTNVHKVNSNNTASLPSAATAAGGVEGVFAAILAKGNSKRTSFQPTMTIANNGLLDMIRQDEENCDSLIKGRSSSILPSLTSNNNNTNTFNLTAALANNNTSSFPMEVTKVIGGGITALRGQAVSALTSSIAAAAVASSSSSSTTDAIGGESETLGPFSKLQQLIASANNNGGNVTSNVTGGVTMANLGGRTGDLTHGLMRLVREDEQDDDDDEIEREEEEKVGMIFSKMAPPTNNVVPPVEVTGTMNMEMTEVDVPSSAVKTAVAALVSSSASIPGSVTKHSAAKPPRATPLRTPTHSVFATKTNNNNNNNNAAAAPSSVQKEPTLGQFGRLLLSAKKDVTAEAEWEVVRDSIASAKKLPITRKSSTPQRGPFMSAPPPPVSGMTVDDFLSAVGIRFFTDANANRRKSSIAPPLLNSDRKPLSLLEATSLLFTTDVERKVIEGGASQLQAALVQSRENLLAFEDHLSLSNPKLFADVMTGSDADILKLTQNLKTLRKKCKNVAELEWVQWRKKLESSIADNLVTALKALTEDLGDLRSASDKVSEEIAKINQKKKMDSKKEEKKAIVSQLKEAQQEQQDVIDLFSSQLSQLEREHDDVVSSSSKSSSSLAVDSSLINAPPPQDVFELQLVHSALSQLSNWKVDKVSAQVIDVSFPEMVRIHVEFDATTGVVTRAESSLLASDSFVLSLVESCNIDSLLLSSSFSQVKQLADVLSTVSFRIGRIQNLIKEITETAMVCDIKGGVEEEKKRDGEGNGKKKAVVTMTFVGGQERCKFAIKVYPTWFYPSGKMGYVFENIWGKFSQDDLEAVFIRNSNPSLGRLRRIAVDIAGSLHF